MEVSAGFAAVERLDARILILGSLPGRKSIALQQYYGHPQNAFWPIMRQVFNVDGSYEERCAGLVMNRVALWDVLTESVRPGSLDSNIHTDTARANDFARFFGEHSEVRRVLFNGKKAQQLFQRLVSPGLCSQFELVALPSTSPAYAAMPFSRKLAIWRSALGTSTKEQGEVR